MSHSRTEDDAAIQAVMADSYKAWSAGDADGMVADYTEGPLKDTSTYNKQLSIRFVGSDAAIVVSESGILFGSQTEVPDAAEVNNTWVLQKRDGRWLIAAYHNSPAQAPVQ
jgi:uncharacterized protein (TIGR02246 family)